MDASPNPLRAFREAKGMSLDDVAKALGVAKATVSRIETGNQGIANGLLLRIADWSKGQISVDDLLRSIAKQREADQ